MSLKNSIIKILFVNKEFTGDSLTNLVITVKDNDKELYNILKEIFDKEIWITKRNDGSINYIIKGVEFKDLKKFIDIIA